MNNRVKLALAVAATAAMLTTTGVVVYSSPTYAQSQKVATVKEAKVIIDGKQLTPKQPAIVQNGNTLVPMRDIFEVLGAKLDWNKDTQTVTATKDKTTISIKLGAKTATVNGNIVTLAAPARILNGSTLVPLRFVSEALGANVKWDAVTYTASITSDSNGGKAVTPPQTQQTVQGVYSKLVPQKDQTLTQIKVKHGKHGYAVANQTEYDFVMKKVNDSLQGIDHSKFNFSDTVMVKNYMDYLTGKDKPENYQKGSREYNRLKGAEKRIEQMRSYALSDKEIIKAVNVGNIASGLAQGKTDPGNGLPTSAYDSLGRNLSDCDSDAQVLSATFDAAGYNTAIISRPDHADFLVELGGKWYTYGSAQFTPYTSDYAKDGYKVTTQSTTGKAVTYHDTGKVSP